MENRCQGNHKRYLEIRSASLHPETSAHYRVHINSLLDFLGVHYPELDSLAKVQRDPHILAWLDMLAKMQPPYTNNTRRQFIYHVRRFLDDIREWGWPESPSRRLFRRHDFPPRQYRSQPKKQVKRSTEKSAASSSNLCLLDDPWHRTLKRYLDIRSATLHPRTIRKYWTHLNSLVEFLRILHPEVDCLAKLQRAPHIEGWLQEMAKRRPPYKNGTRRKYIRSVRRFFDDVREWDWIDGPPPGLIRADDFPPPQRYLPKPLPPEVDVALLEELKERDDLISLGLILARKTGLRVGELCRLEMDCLVENPAGRYSILVPLGKLRSERVIPVDPETAALVKTIRTERGQRQGTVEDPETGRRLELLLCSQKGRFIHPNTFNRKLKSVAKEAGISENVYPHRLRHSYATDLLRNGVSLPGIMKLLGHRTLKMTLRYVEVTNEDLGRDYLKAMDKARQQYAELRDVASGKAQQRHEPLVAIEVAFDQLVTRIQTARFDHPDANRRKKLQRYVERLRRAQAELPNLLG